MFLHLSFAFDPERRLYRLCCLADSGPSDGL